MICKCYDIDNQQCLCGPERRPCSCEGNEADCNFYPEVRKNATPEVNIEDFANKSELQAEITNLKIRLNDCIEDLTQTTERADDNEQLVDDLKFQLQYYKGFYDAVKMSLGLWEIKNVKPG